MAQDELFLEQMIRRGDRRSVLVKRVIIVLSAVVVGVFPFLLSPQLSFYAGPVLLLAAALAGWILWRRASVEYEYIFTDGNIDIDVIYSAVSRKHVVTVDVKKCRVIAPALDAAAQAVQQEKHDQTVRAIEGDIDERTYVMAETQGEKRVLIYFQPNEAFLEAIRKYAPRVLVMPR